MKTLAAAPRAAASVRRAPTARSLAAFRLLRPARDSSSAATVRQHLHDLDRHVGRRARGGLDGGLLDRRPRPASRAAASWRRRSHRRPRHRRRPAPADRARVLRPDRTGARPAWTTYGAYFGRPVLRLATMRHRGWPPSSRADRRCAAAARRRVRPRPAAQGSLPACSSAKLVVTARIVARRADCARWVRQATAPPGGETGGAAEDAFGSRRQSRRRMTPMSLPWTRTSS